MMAGDSLAKLRALNQKKMASEGLWEVRWRQAYNIIPAANSIGIILT